MHVTFAGIGICYDLAEHCLVFKPEGLWSLNGLGTNRLAGRTKQGTKGSWSRCYKDKDKAKDKAKDSDEANEGQDKDKVKGRNDEQQFTTNVTKLGTKQGWLV